MTHYVRLIFLGDYSSARKAIRHIKGDITGLTAQIRMIALAGPAAVGAALSTIPLAFAALGAYAVSENEKVVAAFAHMKSTVLGHLAELAAGFVPIIVDMFGKAEQSFQRISPMLGAIFQKVAPYITQLGEAVLRFAETIMPAFHFAIQRSQPLIDALVKGIDALGQGFAMFIRNVAIATPSAALALQNLLQLLGDLLPILGRIIAVLTEGFGPVLGEVSFAIQGFAFAILDFVKHLTAAAPAISSIFNSWIQFWSGMLKVMGPVIEALLNAMAPILEEVRNLLFWLVDTIGQMVIPILQALGPPIAAVVRALTDALRPSLWAISQGFADMAPLLAEVARGLGELLIGAINALKPILKPLVDLALQLLEVFLRWVPPILQIATDLMPVLGDVLSVVVKDGLLPMIDALLPLVNELMPVVIDAFRTMATTMATDMVPVLTDLARQLFPILVDVIKMLVPILVDLVKEVLPILIDLWVQQAGVLTDLARTAIPLVADIFRDVLIPLIRDVVVPVIKILAEQVIPALARVFSELLIPLLKNVVIPAIKWLSDIFRDYVIPFLRDYVIPFISVTLTGAIKVVATLINDLIDGIKFVAGKVVEFFKGLPEMIFGFLVDMPRRMFESGAGLIQSFADGMNSKVSAARDAGIVAVDAASNPFPSSPAKTGPFSGQGYTLYRGQRMIEDFAEGIRMAAPNLANIASQVLSGASAAISGFLGQGGTANATIPGVGAIQLKVAPGADSALASLLMNMVRTGQLQLQRA